MTGMSMRPSGCTNDTAISSALVVDCPTPKATAAISHIIAVLFMIRTVSRAQAHHIMDFRIKAGSDGIASLRAIAKQFSKFGLLRR